VSTKTGEVQDVPLFTKQKELGYHCDFGHIENLERAGLKLWEDNTSQPAMSRSSTKSERIDREYRFELIDDGNT
jgi:hypothetical protein